jgi:hypothetical protein
MKKIIFSLFLLVLCTTIFSEKFILKNNYITVNIFPATLEMTAKINNNWARISYSQKETDFELIKKTDHEIIFLKDNNNFEISFKIENEKISFNSKSLKDKSIIWPIIGKDSELDAFIIPFSTGSYIPYNDKNWLEFLTKYNNEIDSMEGLSFLAFALDMKGYTLNFFFTNLIYNTIIFENINNNLFMSINHDFKKNNTEKEYGFEIYIGKDDPTEVAHIYRKILEENNQFISFEEKIKENPKSELLLGAAHIYFHATQALSIYDIKNYSGFCTFILSDNAQAKYFYNHLDSQTKLEIKSIENTRNPYLYIKRNIVNSINQILKKANLYNENIFKNFNEISEIKELLDKKIDNLNDSQLYRLNSLLFYHTFKPYLNNFENFGDAASLNMINNLKNSGLDRLWLGMSHWEGGLFRPEFVDLAVKNNYLIGIYDSYGSVHDINSDQETAVFDKELYTHGGIIKEDGTVMKGFAQKGKRLSTIAAKPYVTKRIEYILENMNLNSYFLDVDGYGELFDNYNPLHSYNKYEDLIERIERMELIKNNYNMVLGTERGVFYSAPYIHFNHGMLTPVLVWADEEMRLDRNSEYYLGGYWPPQDPAIFTKQVKLKELYEYVYYDFRFRLPLFEIIFNDSVISTHHWGYSSLKFSNQIINNKLVEIFYNSPPLYHLNLDTLNKQKETILNHYQIFSPLHKKLTLEKITEFKILSEDRNIQSIVYGNKVQMILNFSNSIYKFKNTEIPTKSILIIDFENNNLKIYTP